MFRFLGRPPLRDGWATLGAGVAESSMPDPRDAARGLWGFERHQLRETPGAGAAVALALGTGAGMAPTGDKQAPPRPANADLNALAAPTLPAGASASGARGKRAVG